MTPRQEVMEVRRSLPLGTRARRKVHTVPILRRVYVNKPVQISDPTGWVKPITLQRDGPFDLLMLRGWHVIPEKSYRGWPPERFEALVKDGTIAVEETS